MSSFAKCKSIQELELGLRVSIIDSEHSNSSDSSNNNNAIGIIKYLGPTQFKSGNWVGVELEEDFIGKNDGSIQGVRYFTCSMSGQNKSNKPNMKGIFVRPDNVSVLKNNKLSKTNLRPKPEDDYISLFNMQTRAFRYNKQTSQWIEIGFGDTFFRYVTPKKKKGKFWIYLANGTVDHYVDSETKIQESTVTAQQSWVFRAVETKANSTSGKPKRAVLCLQFQSINEARVFVSTFEGCRKSMIKSEGDQSTIDDEEKKVDSLQNQHQKRRTMRRRLTVSGSDPLLDGHESGARHNEPLSPQTITPNAFDGDGHESNGVVRVSAYSGVSRKGIAPYNPDKQNQDSMTMQVIQQQSLLLCVYDGHGENGHMVSRYFKSRMPELLSAHEHFEDDIKIGDIVNGCLLQTETELINDYSVDTTLSGTTAVVSVLRNNKLFVANVGDSRVIKGTIGPNDNLVAVDLSQDHKPDLPKEQQRIEQSGGRVFAMKYDDGVDGPARVWLSYADMPGLAMSRSLCDTVAKEAGVISNAELFVHDLQPQQDKFIVLATDGLWEFMSSQEVVDIVAKYMKPQPRPIDAIKELVQESNLRWRREEPVIDDTTIVVAYLH